MNDDVLTRNDDGELAVRTVSATETSTVVNPNDVYTRDTDGNLAIRTVGGSGGDQHNLGYFATLEDLQTAYPTAEAGDWAIVGTTDTVWIWDTDNSAWVDSDQKGQVTSVNSKTGVVVLTAEDVEAIPQYSTMPLASLNNNGHIVQFTGTTDLSYTNGYFYKCSASGTEITSGSCVVSNFVGDISDTPIPTISFNKATFDAYLLSNNLDPITSPDIAFSIGSNPDTGDPVLEVTYNSVVSAIMIDMNDTDVSTIETTMATLGFTAIISEDTGFGSCDVALPTNTSYAWARIDVQPNGVTSVNGQTGAVTITEADILPSQTGNAGKILKTNGTTASWEDTTSTPATTPTLAVADWSSNTQTISVTGVTATNTVIVSPTPVSAEDYATAGVLCTNQGAGTLTFTCQSTPANDLTVNIVII